MKKLKPLFKTVICLFVFSWATTTQLNATVYEAYDFASYQAAIAAVNAGSGGDIIKITGDIQIPEGAQTEIKNDVTITADTNPDGTPKYTITGNVNQTAILCGPKKHCTIENLIVSKGYQGIFIRFANYTENNSVIKINNCISTNNTQNGIVINGYRDVESPKITISNCISSNNKEAGIRMISYLYDGSATIHNCTTNNNEGGGIYVNDLGNVYIYDCVANTNGRGDNFVQYKSGIQIASNYTFSNSTRINNCTANGNGSAGFRIPDKSVISNCMAAENEDWGFSGSFQAINCTAIRNGRDGFYMGHGIINNCSAINNGYRTEWEGAGFQIQAQGIISNSTAVNNSFSGFKCWFSNIICVNVTAYGNNDFGINGVNVYNSIIYNNRVDFNNDIWNVGKVYNTVWQTEEKGTIEKHNCTTDEPNLLWVDENGEPVSDLSAAAYYLLGSGSSALDLADKSIINKQKIFETIFDDDDVNEWFESIVTEEYIANILMYDQLGNAREFNGDRYDAGSIAGNGATPTPLLTYGPKKAANYGKCTITFYGNGFDENTMISLKKQGETDIIADTISISNASKCSATFNFHKKKIGKWDIIVNTGNANITIKDGFELEQVIEPEIELEIIGTPNPGNGRTNSYIVKYSNKGNVNAYCQPIIVEIITNKGFSVEVKERWNYFYTDGVYTDKYATIDGELHRLDTLHILSGEGKYTTFVTPLIPVIPPYGKGYLTFDVVFSKDGGILNEPIEIKASALSPLVFIDPESSGTKFGMAGEPPTFDACLALIGKLLWEAAKVPLSIIPGSGCIIQVGETIYSGHTNNESTGMQVASAAGEMGKILVECGASLLPGGFAVKTAVNIFKAICTANDMVEYALMMRDCIKSFAFFGQLIGSCDPNDKIGPVSESGSTWISDRKDFTYVINFENSPEATAPAQEVWITDTLDLNVFNINSFEAGIMKIGDRIIDFVPFETQNYTWSIDMNPEMNLITEINLTLDKSKGIATWYFKSIDPATGELPTDALRGFLPPNDDEGSGQGFVMFTIKLKEGLPDDVTIANRASIVFDFNDPILTPEWVNKKDIVPPTSAVLKPANITGEIELQWQGEDNPNGSGIYCYDIYMKKDNGAYEPILLKTQATSTTFTIEDGVKYSFYSIATDNAGNREPDKIKPDISIPFDNLPFDTYAVTKWNNTFMLNLKKLAEDGYDVTTCKWYKYSQIIGEGFSYSAGPKNSDKLEAGVVYYFQIITKNGDELFSTNKVLDVPKTALRVYPNPVPQGCSLTVEGTKQGSFVEVFNYMGQCVNRTTATGTVTEITFTLPPGVYIVRSNNETVKVVIQ